ncbi:MAG: TetR/AcrR family transcriptional regulator [Firmicutes bacterium]|nr:TetR/AcrR family transcriptional regulator [Bacillota bacterium]
MTNYDDEDNYDDLPLDGRRARGERTRLKILDSLLALVEEGELRPTAQAVASHAEVALRTVYHHFEDVEALRHMAHDLQIRRNLTLLGKVDSGLGIEEKAKIVAKQLRKFFELITPIRRAILFDEQNSAELAIGLKLTRSARRDHVMSVFADEIKHSEDEKTVTDALDQITSWQAWNFVRVNLARSPQVAEKILAVAIMHLLTPLGNSGAKQKRSKK